MALLLGGISDDFTGGLELASMMARDGLRTRLLTRRAGVADVAELDVAVIALKSRVAPASQAVRDFAKAAALLEHIGARQIFFKYCATFDSTPRGNIGPCADNLADRVGADFVGFCPAFPDVDRTVYQGHLFHADQLISDSPKRLDPLTPMRDPNLVRVLQRQTRHKVGLIRHRDLVGGGVAARVDSLAAAGIRYAICDATSNADLAALAETCVDWKLMTGGSSVAEHYPALWRSKGLAGAPTPAARLRAPGGPAVVLAGSCAAQTAVQLAHFGRTHPVLTLDILRLADDPDLLGPVLARTKDALASGAGAIAIAAATTPDAVAAAQRRFGRRNAARRVETLLGRIAVKLHRDGIRRFVIAGGETSGAILEALQVTSLDIGPYLGPGTARAVTCGPDPISFHLKPGKLGTDDMLDRVVAEDGTLS